MEHYDLRIIEDCLVFSYTVECPNYPKKTEALPKKKMPSRNARKKIARTQRMKKWLLHLLLLVLAPFAIVLDAVGKVVCFSAKKMLCVCRKRPVPARIIGTVSCLCMITTVLYLL